MRIGVYPGSFDPVTKGHLDIIERASKIFEKIIVVVSINTSKSPLFTLEERIDLLKESCKHIKNVQVDSFDGLLINYLKNNNADVIIKGLRAVSDFEYEFQMALMNRTLEPNIETLFMMTTDKYSYLSSSLVKEVVKFGGKVTGLVPEGVENQLIKKLL